MSTTTHQQFSLDAVDAPGGTTHQRLADEVVGVHCFRLRLVGAERSVVTARALALPIDPHNERIRLTSERGRVFTICWRGLVRERAGGRAYDILGQG